MSSLEQLFRIAKQKNANDIFLLPNQVAQIRVGDQIVSLGTEVLNKEELNRWLVSLLSSKQIQNLESDLHLQTTHSLNELGRYRAQLFQTPEGLAAEFRYFPHFVASLDELGLLRSFVDLSERSQGLILIAGQSNSGRSTTAHAVLEKINRERSTRVVCVARSSEYIHQNQKSMFTHFSNINQYKTHSHQPWQNFYQMLDGQSADVIFWDADETPQTFRKLLRWAEAGKLVIACVTAQTVTALLQKINSYWEVTENQFQQNLLADVLQGIVLQKLLPDLKGARVLAQEIMLPTTEVRKTLQPLDSLQIFQLMQSGQSQSGMVTMNQSIMSLLLKRQIAIKSAFAFSPHLEELELMLRKAGV